MKHFNSPSKHKEKEKKKGKIVIEDLKYVRKTLW